MKQFYLAVAVSMLAAIPALASEATFDRSMTVSGRVELRVSTGSGNIHLAQGADNQVHVIGKIKSGWGGGEERVQQIASNPPIEQTGNTISIGGRHENLHNISIDYEIQAPADTFLEASSGWGDLIDDGVGENAKLSTGAGNIRATGMRGNFSIDIGSGSIYAVQAGKGDVKALTGSGNVELKDLNGGLNAGTGSGNIKVSGIPTSSWHVHTGSGSVEFWAGNAPLTLDASTGWGTIHCDRDMVMRGTVNTRHSTGNINGGGPTVRIETGSGDIWVR